MLTLYSGRPTDSSDRSDKELQCYDLLDRLSIPFTRVDHESAMTMEVCAEIEKSLGSPICKNLFLCNRQETSFYLLLIPGNKPFKTKYLSQQLGVSRLSFGKESFMADFLNTAPGSASVLGLMNDRDHRVQLVIDRDLLQQASIGCHPCINTSSLGFSTQDLMQVLLPAVNHTPVFVDLPWEDSNG